MAYFTVERYRRGGETLVHSYIKKADAVSVLVETRIEEEVHILLTQQFRIGPFINEGQMSFQELPAGNIDIGESPMQAAERELYEETRVILLTPLISLGLMYPSPGCFTEKVYLYYYFLCDHAEATLKVCNPSESEVLINMWVPKKALQLKDIQDAKLLSALALSQDIIR